MRTKASIRNIIFSCVVNVISLLIGFVAQAIFLKTMGEEFLGINGLFTNIISMLSIVELGIGTAIVYYLYKPLAENNESRIRRIMNFYGSSYKKIAITILMLGICITPFLNYLVGENNVSINIYVVYILFVLDASLYYILSYKRTILVANEKNYYINIVHLVYLLLLNFLQILVLYLTKDYYLYVIIKIIMRVLENIIINIIVKFKYPYLSNIKKENLDIDTKNDIKQKIKSLIFHKLGTFIVSGTDNILISIIFGLGSVGLYSNYYMIINAIYGILVQVFNSVTASVGNLLLEKNQNKNYSVYKRILFANTWISIFTSVSLYICIDAFIAIWIGKEFILGEVVLITLIANYYFTTMRMTYNIFKDSAGIYYEDRFIPLIESFCNIAFSIVFAKFFGLAGIFMGTISSQLILHLYSYYKYVCKKLFGINYYEYLKVLIKNILLLVFSMILSKLLSNALAVENNILYLIICIAVSLIVTNFILLIVFHKSNEFKYYNSLFKKIIFKVFNKTKEENK